MTRGGNKLLCIDADEGTALWIRNQLEDAGIGCDVSSVATGREGFRRLNDQSFDLCILDYALPDMTGAQLCALMRQMGSPVPMLFFTPMNRSIDRERAELAGSAGYLVKPEDTELFVDTVVHLLKRSTRVYAVPRRVTDFLAKAA